MADFRRAWQLSAVVLLLVTGGLMVFQVNLRMELSDTREKLRTLETWSAALRKDLRDTSHANAVSEIQKRALQQQLLELQEDHTDVKQTSKTSEAILYAKLQGAAGETKKLKDQLSTCENRNAALLAEKRKQVQVANRLAVDSKTRAQELPKSAAVATTGNGDQQNSAKAQAAAVQRVVQNEQQRRQAIRGNPGQESKATPKI